MCECYQIGGPWIAEDPECPAHGYLAVREQEETQDRIFALEQRVVELEALLATQQWHSSDVTLEYLTRCSDGTIFRNAVKLPAHAIEWFRG